MRWGHLGSLPLGSERGGHVEPGRADSEFGDLLVIKGRSLPRAVIPSHRVLGPHSSLVSPHF